MSDNSKKNMSKKTFFSGITVATAITIVILCVAGGTLAYFFTKTNNIVNTFVPGEVKCSVQEDMNGNTKETVTVKNEGSTAAFIRVAVTYYMKDESAPPNEILGLNAQFPTNFELGEGWVLGSDKYYYYLSPVAPGASTGRLFKEALKLETYDDNVVDVVEIFGEALQCTPDEAVLEAWGKTASNGAVTGVGADGKLLVEAYS